MIPQRPDVVEYDTPLGRWRQTVWTPPALRGSVRAIWYFEGSLAHARERILPPGTVDLTLALERIPGEPPTAALEGGTITGQITRALTVAVPDGDTAQVGIRLHGPGAASVLGRPVHELRDGQHDLGELMPSGLAELERRLPRGGSPEAWLRAVADWLGSLIRRQGNVDPFALYAAREITASGGNVRIAALRGALGVGKTRFTSVFQERVGVPPKVFARIIRFQRAMELVRTGCSNISHIALDCGYSDQPHFTHEFRSTTGFTPGAFPAELLYPGSTVFLAEPR